jgi:ribosomal-protein-alanine N-acetyltransferase
MLLEVRVSNRQALAFYSRFGFREIGRRKNYYPAADNLREDALMMTMPL